MNTEASLIKGIKSAALSQGFLSVTSSKGFQDHFDTNVVPEVARRIINAGGSRGPLLSISGQNLGKIDSGELVKISPTKIPRLIGKHGSMIQTIESSTNATITIGQNGLIVVSSNETNGLLKALAAIRMVEEQAHLVDLTDKVKKMLESNGV